MSESVHDSGRLPRRCNMNIRCCLCVSKTGVRSLQSPSCPKRKSLVDWLFESLCSINGLQFSDKPGRWRNGLFLFIWCCVSTFRTWFAISKVYVVFLVNKEVIGLAKIMMVFGGCALTLTTTYNSFVFVRKGESMRKLLRSEGRSLRDFLLPTIFVILNNASPLWVLGSSNYYEGTVAVIYMLCDTITMSGFFCVYTDILESIFQRHENILLSVQSLPKQAESSIVVKKWQARRIIRETNALFAVILSMYYIQAPLIFVIGLAQTMEQTSKLGDSCMILLVLCSFVGLLWLGAIRCSAIASACCGTEHVFAEAIDSCDSICRRCQKQHLRVLAYREDWDSLKMAFFSQNAPNLVGYLVTCMTCVAVVLQFDIKVVRNMANWSSQMRGNSTT